MTSDFWSRAVDGSDGRLDAPAFHRNREPIFQVLEPRLRALRGTLLEIGSGSGQHAVDYASRLPGIDWQPSDFDPAARTSIEAWRKFTGLPNLRPPLAVDLMRGDWTARVAESIPTANLIAIFCANVIHISPATVTPSLISGAAKLLHAGRHLFLYGPFKRDGVHTSPSNEQFDQTLRSRNPEWGLRDITDLKFLAEANGLALAEQITMPANNFTLVFERRG